MFVSSVII